MSERFEFMEEEKVTKCTVTGCRSGYNKSKTKQENSDHGEKVQLHKFPDDKVRKALCCGKVKFRIKTGT